MAREAGPDTRTGWVYRSDPLPAEPRPPAADLVPVTPARPAPPHAEPRTSASVARPERGWIESGFHMMTLPLTLTVRIMLAPVNWMFGARPWS